MNIILLIFGILLGLISLALKKSGTVFLQKLNITNAEKIIQNYFLIYLLLAVASIVASFFVSNTVALIFVIITLLISFTFSIQVSKQLNK